MKIIGESKAIIYTKSTTNHAFTGLYVRNKTKIFLSNLHFSKQIQIQPQSYKLCLNRVTAVILCPRSISLHLLYGNTY